MPAKLTPAVRAPKPHALDLTPMEVAARGRHLPGFVFFDTALESGEIAQLSIVAAAPVEIVRGHADADWARLRARLAARQTDAAPDDGLPNGFAAGFVEYDGAFCFGFYEDALIFRHADHSWHEVGELWTKIERGAGPVAPGHEPLVFTPEITPAQFCAMVARAQEYIAAGDIYQVNLAHRCTAPWQGDAFAFYEALRHYSPAPHAAYLALDGRAILSASPEEIGRAHV